MFNLERWSEIFDTLRKNKYRTILTGISVASGIFILVILLGVGKGMRNGINDAFAGDAINSFLVRGNFTRIPYKGLDKNRRIQLDIEDYESLRRQIAPYIDLQSPVYRNRSVSISYKTQNSSYQVQGIYPDHFRVENCILDKGRALNYGDVQQHSKVAVLGAIVEREIFKEKNPIGEQILINNIPFTIIGTYTDKFGNWDENKIYIPYDTATQIFDTQDKLSFISFTLNPQKNVSDYMDIAESLFDRVEDIMKTKYKIAPSDENGIRIDQALSEAKRIYTMMDVMRLFFWVVGICTIIAGVVGVSNIMFIIVKERTKEIGIRKALGAKPWSIIGMILHESVFLTTISGFFGLIISLILWEVVGPYIDTKFFKNPSVDFSVAIGAVTVLIIAGTLAGFFPAYRAAKIKPIEALKDE